MTATNMFSNFGGFRCSLPPYILYFLNIIIAHISVPECVIALTTLGWLELKYSNSLKMTPQKIAAYISPKIHFGRF